MAITILTGLPGSGKSETLIAAVRNALQEGRNALTMMCGDAPVLRARRGITEHRRIGCRTGMTTPLDHFVSAAECIRLLDEVPPSAVVAFDEAQHFGEQLVQAWCTASDRGVEILIASPSAAQLKRLNQPRVLGHASGGDLPSLPGTCGVPLLPPPQRRSNGVRLRLLLQERESEDAGRHRRASPTERTLSRGGANLSAHRASRVQDMGSHSTGQ